MEFDANDKMNLPLFEAEFNIPNNPTAQKRTGPYAAIFLSKKRRRIISSEIAMISRILYRFLTVPSFAFLPYIICG